MIELTDKLWIGNSKDGEGVGSLGVGAALNVAQDLEGALGWPHVVYAQVGLIDGPGNPVSAYCAAVLTLASLLGRGGPVLVYCHSGGRSLAVALMYLCLTGGRRGIHPTFLSCRRGWSELIRGVQASAGAPLPAVHPAHREAFDKMPFGMLETFV